jgi:hypothetical protein
MFLNFLRLFLIPAKKDSGESSDVVNCAVIKAKWRRPLPLSNVKDKIM